MKSIISCYTFSMSTTQTCQKCKKDFSIEDRDKNFYQKMKVPAPTFCPDCRFQRRLAFFNLTKLYKRSCDLCQKDGLSMYHPDAPYVVYCPKCWWSDQWDFEDFGRDYDFSRPFFEQYHELWKSAPMLGLTPYTENDAPYILSPEEYKREFLG